MSTLVHLGIVLGCFCTTRVELSTVIAVETKAKNTYSLTLYRKNVPVLLSRTRIAQTTPKQNVKEHTAVLSLAI